MSEQLHNKVDSEPSPEPKAVNVPISFGSSWKTRGDYFNISFGAAISTSTKKVLDDFESYIVMKELKQRIAIIECIT